jgi:hypothetical protein
MDRQSRVLSWDHNEGCCHGMDILFFVVGRDSRVLSRHKILERCFHNESRFAAIEMGQGHCLGRESTF